MPQDQYEQSANFKLKNKELNVKKFRNILFAALPMLSFTSIANAIENQVLCSDQSKIEMFDETLKKVLFTVDRHETVKVFQGWGKNEVKLAASQKNFVRVTVTDLDHDQELEGFVDQSLIKDFSQCASAVKEEEEFKDYDALAQAQSLQSLENSSDKRGLNSNNLIFPLKKETDAPYSGSGAGMRAFGGRRDGGRRSHAACDLYSNLGSEIRAVTDGKVLRGPYFYYLGTYALEVKHTGGFVAVYGEIMGKSAAGVRPGKAIGKGQTVGYMGRVKTKSLMSPMLHFELYAGTMKGPIRSNGNRFQRRADLINPTQYLLQMEERSF